MTEAVDLTRSRRPHWRRFMFPCDCDDHHWLSVEWWDDGDDWPLLEIVPTLWATTVTERIKAAVKLLFGRRHHSCDGVLLDPATARDLIEIVSEHAERPQFAAMTVADDGELARLVRRHLDAGEEQAP